MNETDDAINPDKKALSMRLKGLRESFSWTLGELSQATKQIDPMSEGISKVSISRYENGDSYPGFREIKLLAQAFGVSVSFLFYGDVPDPYAGWEFSLDEYLRSVIKDVLIEEGVIEGESRSDRERKKTMALRAIQARKGPLSTKALDEADKAEYSRLQKQELAKLEEQAKQVDDAAKRRIRNNQK